MAYNFNTPSFIHSLKSLRGQQNIPIYTKAMINKKKILILMALILPLSTHIVKGQEVELPDIEPLVLQSSFDLYHYSGLEISGVVKSRSKENLFWFHNDSGNDPHVFPINEKGEFFTSKRFKRQDGVKLLGAHNIDWEDMCVTRQGDLIIADFGNNYNDRKDLVFYVFSEPAPYADFITVRKKIFFRYPDQKAFPDSSDLNYDSEAVFHANGYIHVLTKHRSDTYTKLYRLEMEEVGEVNVLTYMDQFNIQGKVTGADVSRDENKLVVITYDGIWLFERTKEYESYFKGNISYLPYEATQIESVCFNGDDKIMLIDEATSDVFEVKVDQLVSIKQEE